MTNRRFKFTAAVCRKLAAPAMNSKSNDIQYTDTEVRGLKFAVSKSGLMTWYYTYTLSGKKETIRIGAFPDISVSGARKIARGYAAKISQGIDPKIAVTQQKSRLRFSDFTSQLYMPYSQEFKRSYKSDESKLRLHLNPVFGHCFLDDISPQAITAYLLSISVSNSAATSNRHRSLLSNIFRKAEEWGFATKNPCASINKLIENPPPAKIYDNEDMIKIMNALANEGNQVAALALQLLFVTGLRLNEVLSLEWRNVDIANTQIYLADTKSGRGRYVPINAEAVKILTACLANRCATLSSQWVFPSKVSGKHLSNPRKAWRRALTAANVEFGRIHDIRHSFASACVRSGASLYVVQNLLGHSSPTTTQRYAHLADNELNKASSKAVSGFLPKAA